VEEHLEKNNSKKKGGPLLKSPTTKRKRTKTGLIKEGGGVKKKNLGQQSNWGKKKNRMLRKRIQEKGEGGIEKGTSTKRGADSAKGVRSSHAG